MDRQAPRQRAPSQSTRPHRFQEDDRLRRQHDDREEGDQGRGRRGGRRFPVFDETFDRTPRYVLECDDGLRARMARVGDGREAIRSQNTLKDNLLEVYKERGIKTWRDLRRPDVIKRQVARRGGGPRTAGGGPASCALRERESGMSPRGARSYVDSGCGDPACARNRQTGRHAGRAWHRSGGRHSQHGRNADADKSPTTPVIAECRLPRRAGHDARPVVL